MVTHTNDQQAAFVESIRLQQQQVLYQRRQMFLNSGAYPQSRAQRRFNEQRQAILSPPVQIYPQVQQTGQLAATLHSQARTEGEAPRSQEESSGQVTSTANPTGEDPVKTTATVANTPSTGNANMRRTEQDQNRPPSTMPKNVGRSQQGLDMTEVRARYAEEIGHEPLRDFLVCRCAY